MLDLNKEKFDKNNMTVMARMILVVIILTLLATFISFLIKNMGFTEVNIVIVYILSVLLASRYTGDFIYGVFASLVATLSFNFFFTEPTYTFSVNDKSYIFTFIIMLVAAVFSSTLTSKLIQAKEIANAQEKQAKTLYKVTSSLAKTRGTREVIYVSMNCLADLFLCDVICLIPDKKRDSYEKLTLTGSNGQLFEDLLPSNQVNRYIDCLNSMPIKVHGETVCIICLPGDLVLTGSDSRYLLDSVYMQVAIAVEREYVNWEVERAKIEAEQERFKSNLLRAISHDLRTPLSVISGAAEMLLHNLKDDYNREVVAGIYEDTIWLTRLVENILSLTRIQEGRLNVFLQEEAVEEIVAEAIRRVQKYAPGRKITVSIPDEILFVPMDSKLIVQVLINILDNAVKHTDRYGVIKVQVVKADDRVWFEIADNGAGIDESDIEKLFEIFYVTDIQRRDSKRGMGLGLAICKAIINMHGGEIFAENKPDGGALFRFFLKR